MRTPAMHLSHQKGGKPHSGLVSRIVRGFDSAQWGQPLLLDAVAGIMGLVMDLKIYS